MKKSIAIYVLCICFLSIAVFMCSFGTVGYAAVKILKPEWTIPSSDYEKYQNNDAYLRGFHRSTDESDSAVKKGGDAVSALTK